MAKKVAKAKKKSATKKAVRKTAKTANTGTFDPLGPGHRVLKRGGG